MREAPVADRFDPSLGGAVVSQRDMPARREHQALQPVGDPGEYHALRSQTDASSPMTVGWHDGTSRRRRRRCAWATAALVSIVPSQSLTKAANLLFRVRTSALVLSHRHDGMSARPDAACIASSCSTRMMPAGGPNRRSRLDTSTRTRAVVDVAPQRSAVSVATRPRQSSSTSCSV